jgi:hypothetical protein
VLRMRDGVGLMIGTKISCAQALVVNGRAMTRMLDEPPEAEKIRPELSKPYFIETKLGLAVEI